MKLELGRVKTQAQNYFLRKNFIGGNRQTSKFRQKKHTFLSIEYLHNLNVN